MVVGMMSLSLLMLSTWPLLLQSGVVKRVVAMLTRTEAGPGAGAGAEAGAGAKAGAIGAQPPLAALIRPRGDGVKSAFWYVRRLYSAATYNTASPLSDSPSYPSPWMIPHYHHPYAHGCPQHAVQLEPLRDHGRSRERTRLEADRRVREGSTG